MLTFQWYFLTLIFIDVHNFEQTLTQQTRNKIKDLIHLCFSISFFVNYISGKHKPDGNKVKDCCYFSPFKCKIFKIKIPNDTEMIEH